jgi:hypothetical protein
MKPTIARLALKLVFLFLLLGASLAFSGFENKTTATCWQCVTLDPGGAIRKGCMQTSSGDTGCTPVNGEGCIMSGTWCRARPSEEFETEAGNDW